MVRKHPDVVAILVVGLFLLIANTPRMLMGGYDPRWEVKPLKLELPHAELRAEKDQIRREVQSNVRAHRDAVRSALEEARDEVRQALRGR